MLLICKNSISMLYDDGDNYRMVTKGEEDRLISKDEYPQYPLACCFKWNMAPVDIDYINKLAIRLFKE